MFATFLGDREKFMGRLVAPKGEELEENLDVSHWVCGVVGTTWV